jgi:hypothetical protein
LVQSVAKEIIVFTNPASSYLNVGLNDVINSTTTFTGYCWSIVDQRGVTVMQGNVQESLAIPQQIEIDMLANGMYFMIFTRGDRTVAQRKIAVMNQH